jgi:hypothetical protein
MLQYECSDCGMGVKGLSCSKCGAELKHRTIKTEQGKEVQVSECPKQCGKIKSPMCCGHDMHAQ